MMTQEDFETCFHPKMQTEDCKPKQGAQESIPVLLERLRIRAQVPNPPYKQTNKKETYNII
jgi:hypothetical protein